MGVVVAYHGPRPEAEAAAGAEAELGQHLFQTINLIL